MQQERRCSPKVIIFKIVVYWMLCINMIKYVYLDMPDIEKKLREKNMEENWFKIWVWSLVVGKFVETFLSGYVYFFSLSPFISMIISDSNGIDLIQEVFRLVNDS